MAIVHVSEAEAIRDPAALFQQVREGFEVVIESDDAPIARLIPPEQRLREAEYEAWFLEQVDHALADTREGVDSEVVEAHFAERRRASALKLAGLAG